MKIEKTRVAPAQAPTAEEILKKIEHHDSVIYLDECAAGALSGDLFVCGLVIDKQSLQYLSGVRDSKKLTEKKRTEWALKILTKAKDYELIRITPKEIDLINIFQARMKGFQMAIQALSKRSGVCYAVIDGNKKPKELPIETDFLVKADSILSGVSCASILAKNFHTNYIEKLCTDNNYSKYGLAAHKGYGTDLHMRMLDLLGPLPDFHRYSYGPVKNAAHKS